MAISYGHILKLELWGGSHEPWMGLRMQGLPPGFALDRGALDAFLARRAPASQPGSTTRREADHIELTAGVDKEGRLLGGLLEARIANRDMLPEDYENIQQVPRPGHGDYPAYVREGRIPAGGGKYSGRMTAVFCVAGGIALQILEKQGISIGARILSVGGCAPEEMSEAIEMARAAGDSLGGLVECQIQGLPVGLGDHPFGGLENRIAGAAFAIPGLKAIEFGDGFGLAAMRGSQANDAFYMENDRVMTRSNHCGGILGGMSNGMPLVFRVALKPAPSISLPQDSVDLEKKENVRLSVRGRHDSCYVPRALPVVEAAGALAILDALLTKEQEG